MNGVAAHLINEGDKISIMAFEWTYEGLRSLFILVDENN